MIATLLAAAATLAGLAWFAHRRLMTFLHIFQQEEYDNGRFLAGLRRQRACDRRLTLVLALSGLLAAVAAHAVGENMPAGGAPNLWLAADGVALDLLLCAAGLAAALLALREVDPRKDAKKPLNPTPRARRILGLALTLSLALALLLGFGAAVLLGGTLRPLVEAIAVILTVQLLPLSLVCANLLLAPFERRINRRFLDEARAILARQRPTVVAITGSFGKTSTKHILGHVLSTSVPALVTPGSVNTPLGIARIVREQLKPHHRFFVVEMGAYGRGSIERLCTLTPPDLAAITAVGSAHHERFKSLETVADAKFEIATATLARGGRVVLNADGIPRHLREARTAAAPDRFILVGSEPAEVGARGYLIEAARQAADGLSFTLRCADRTYRIAAPLYGLHQVGNLAVAFALAVALGVPADTVVAALRNVAQVSHRLQVSAAPGQATIIDDSYNSNPVGFASALELLAQLGSEGRRRILVTPGMVELGDRHDVEHRHLGRLAGDLVDVALVIGAPRIASFVAGFEAGRRAGRQLLPMASFAEAKAWLGRAAAPQDVILFENDLPDLYERKLSL